MIPTDETRNETIDSHDVDTAPSPADGYEAADAMTAGTPADGVDRRARRSTPLVVAGLTAVVVAPLVVALAALHSPRWYPVLDLAMTELRVRDVGTRHSPLIGLVGRLSSNGEQGSHPGPISFWALAPTYRLLGGSAWTLFVGVVVLNTTAVALTLWVAARRGGALLALGTAAALAVLVNLYGTQVLTEPWNPYMPVMWWPLTLVAVWSVFCDDLPMLPIAVLAASFCMQTHISYLGLVGGLVAIGTVVLAVRAYRVRGDRAALRRLGLWVGIAGALGVVLWLPPLIDQITGDPGNASIVADHFRHADEEPIGLRRGGEVLGVQMNVWRLAAGQTALSGSVIPGLVLLASWVAAAVGSLRMPATAAGVATPRASLLRLHAVVGLALVLGLVSASRILGHLWYYLTLWAWATTTLMVVAVAWTAIALLSVARPAARRVTSRAVPAALAGVLVLWTVMFAVDARDAEPTAHRVSGTLGDLTVPVLDAIEDGDIVAAGRDGSYRLSWTDGTYIGAPGYGLLAELERRGLDVGATEPYHAGVIDHRVMPAAEADAEIHLSVGPDIEVWQARGDAVMVAYGDPRTDAERARFDRARTASITELERIGRPDLVPLVDRMPFMLFLDESLPDETREVVAPLSDLGQPIAVFIAPIEP